MFFLAMAQGSKGQGRGALCRRSPRRALLVRAMRAFDRFLHAVGQKMRKKASNQPDSQVRLTAPIIQAIQRQQQAGRSIRVFWSDEMCWCGDDKQPHGLSDDDWPFRDQLDLAAFR